MRPKRILSKEEFQSMAKSVNTKKALRRLTKYQSKEINHFIEEYQIDISHFLPSKAGHPLEDYLDNKFPISSHKLRIKLIEESIKEARCEKCTETHWLGQPIPLQLHHINGNHNDNRLLNIKIFCPNCHSLEPNHCGKDGQTKKFDLDKYKDAIISSRNTAEVCKKLNLRDTGANYKMIERLKEKYGWGT